MTDVITPSMPVPPVPGTVELVSTAPPSAEPGWQTTEFWKSFVIASLGLLTMFGIIHPASADVDTVAGGLAAVLPTVAYIISRGIRKQGTPK